MSSGHLSKMPRNAVTPGPLNEDEMDRCAELIHRALVHEQANGIVRRVANHIHGKQIAVHVGSLMNEAQAMTDASKRLRDDDSDWDQVEETEPNLPMTSKGPTGSAGYERVMKSALTNNPEPARDFPLPEGVKTVEQWGKTIIMMPKYADQNVTYKELVNRATRDSEAQSYIKMIQSKFTPKDGEEYIKKSTQAVDFALYLKKTKYGNGSSSASITFERCLK